MANIKKVGILKNQDIAALRYADTISLHSTSLEVPICIVTCKKHLDDEVRTYDFVLPSKVENIALEPCDLTPVEAKVDFTKCNLDWQLQSVFGLLQELDELEIVWLPNVQSSIHKKYHIVHDQVKVVIYRKNKRLHYMLGSFVDELSDSMFNYKSTSDSRCS